jgi:hypothetical protein
MIHIILLKRVSNNWELYAIGTLPFCVHYYWYQIKNTYFILLHKGVMHKQQFTVLILAISLKEFSLVKVYHRKSIDTGTPMHSNYDGLGEI